MTVQASLPRFPMPCDPCEAIAVATQTQSSLNTYIASGGGGSGTGIIQVYTGAAPPAAPDDPAEAALFYPDGGGTMQQWDVVSQAWV